MVFHCLMFGQTLLACLVTKRFVSQTQCWTNVFDRLAGALVLANVRQARASHFHPIKSCALSSRDFKSKGQMAPTEERRWASAFILSKKSSPLLPLNTGHFLGSPAVYTGDFAATL